MKATNIQADYLDTSNPYRLIAFFKFCDCANIARDGIANLKIDEPQTAKAHN